MKTLPTLVVAISFALAANAQTRSVLERGPHHALYPPSDGSPDGAPTLVLETGLHYWSPETKEWLPADPSLPMNATGDAFVAHKTLGQLRASAQINTVGAITVNLDPQDPTRQLVTTPVAIALEEPVTGRMLIVGTITNSLGSLVEGTTNQIIYEDCFAGVCASYVVEVQRGTYSADVVFTGKFDVRDWGFTTNARIQIITEIYGPPPDSSIRRPLYIEQDPQKIAQAARLGLSLDVIDETLGWGNLVMAEGSAYTAPTPTATNGASVRVAKEIQTADGRLFLVESLSFASLQDQFLRLPQCNPPGGHARLERPEDAKLRYAAIPRLPTSPIVSVQPSSAPAVSATAPQPPLPRPPIHASRITYHAVPSTTPMTTLPLQARIAHRPTGVCVDYIANLGGTLSSAVTFQSSTNILITGSLILNGPVTFEPIIVKYKANAYMQINNTLTLKNFGQFRGAQFTAVDDSSVGDTCAGITNSGYTGVITNTGYANPAIYTAQSSLSLTNCRFSYAKMAVQCVPPLASSSTYNFSHSQLVNCITGIQLSMASCGCGCGGGSFGCGVTIGLNANNCLLANVKYPFYSSLANPSLSLRLANCTLDRASLIAGQTGGGFGLNATNCIFANITNTSAGVTFTGAYNGFYRSAQQFGAAQSTVTDSPFQSAGAGNYYLTAASGFANAGTTAGIPAWLQLDLSKRTIYPPTVVCNVLLTNDQILSPQAPRDTSVCSLGMHYDPIDWALSWVLLTNGTITVNPGTVIAAFGTNAGGGNIGAYGLAIGQNAAFQCQGAPTTPNWFVAYNTVQEQGTNSGGWLPPSSGLLLSEFQGLSPGSVINCRFTRWSVPSLDEPGFNALTNSGPLTFQDCEFHGGKLLSSRPTIDLANCLLERVYANLSSADANSPYIRNCLFLGGIFNFAPNVTNALVKDNLFDQTSIPTNTSIYTTYNGGCNGYVTNKDRLLPWFATDKILTAALAYQTGPLGNYYYPTNGPSGGLTNLFNTGSTWATNVGLYDYTTTTNQVVEDSTMLDIGYHYVAVDSSGNPLDIDSDGLPDYLEDAQWNGLPDFWQWYWFGNYNHTADELDANGNTLLNDYTNGLHPNIIVFTLSATNSYVSTSSPGLQLSVTAGTPAFYTILVDSTNFASANWTAYTSSSITANLGANEGWHEIWVGLRGPPRDAQQTWAWQRLKLDLTPPQLVITGPTNGTLTVPLLQLTGYSPEALSGLSYGISNAAGTTTGLQAVITGQFYSTNTAEFTTNYFQCYDVPLTNGLNVITLQAIDLAGNMATLATNIVCSPTTNPPVVALLWPQDGMQISGGSITIQGQVNDPTATVSLAVVDASGATNYVNGLVGRDGIFWVENVALNAGTNLLALTLSNPAGSTTTNFTLIQSTVGLSVSPVQPGDTTVNGTIGAGGYTIWVNGGLASQNGGNWTAQIAPVGVGGGLVAVTAIPNSGPRVNAQATVQTPQGVFISQYHHNQQTDVRIYWDRSWTWQHSSDVMGWGDGGGGTNTLSFYEDCLFYTPALLESDWPVTAWPQALTNGVETSTIWNNLATPPTVTISTSIADGPALPQVHCDINQTNPAGTKVRRTEDTEMKLATGGPLGSRQMNLWCLSASATDVDTGLPIPPEEIEIGGYGYQDTNAELWVLLPDNDPALVTPKAKWKKHYSFGASGTQYLPGIIANDQTLSDKYVWPGRDFCVGQGIYFNVVGLPDRVHEAVAVWSLPGTFVNRQPDPNCLAYYDQDATLLTRSTVTNGALTTYAWYVRDVQPATVSVTVSYRFTRTGPWFTQTLSGKFNVHRPTATFIPPSSLDGTPTVIIANGCLALGSIGSKDMSFGHQVLTTSFSGQAGYTQVVGDGGDEIQTYQNNPILIQPDNELDNCEFPNGQSAIPTNASTPVQFSDRPRVSLANNYSETFENLHFHTYLLFKPDGGPGQNIFVPLRKVDWSLNDDATYGPTGWTPTGSASNPSDADSESFPHWTGIIYNSQFLW